jgi:hypothetical protein
MHSKGEALRLLSLITDAVKTPESANFLNKPAFTGMDIKTVSAEKGGKKVSKEQKDHD